MSKDGFDFAIPLETHISMFELQKKIIIFLY